MKKIHAKSQCCSDAVYRFGKRRRQCSHCKKTWRVHQKRRGRKRRRPTFGSVQRVFLRGYPLPCREGLSRQLSSHRFRQALNALARQPPRYSIPSEPLVLIADAVWFWFKRQQWTLYLMALKAPEQRYAEFVDPVLLPGRECGSGWKTALSCIPVEIFSSIQALVCDHVQGLRTMGVENKWHVQLCHVHLLRQVFRRLGRKSHVSAKEARYLVYGLIRKTLREPDPSKFMELHNLLRKAVKAPGFAKRFGMVVRWYSKFVDYYRTYLNYPELGIPFSTNTLEAKAGQIRDLLRRARHVRTPQALQLWATTHVRLNRKVACQTPNFQPN